MTTGFNIRNLTLPNDEENPVLVTGTKTVTECRHYWLIDRANGPVSHAVCKYCHAERDFSNAPQYEIGKFEPATGLKPVRKGTPAETRELVKV